MCHHHDNDIQFYFISNPSKGLDLEHVNGEEASIDINKMQENSDLWVPL